MNIRIRSIGALAAALLALNGAALAEPVSYTILQNGENVGYLKVDEQGSTAAIDYYVDSNGRGPKHAEEITVDSSGIPTSWTVRGTSLMGGAVEETFAASNGTAYWISQADQGRLKLAGPSLYAINDGSPWADYVYVRALLKDADRRMAVIPAGEVSLEEVGGFKVTAGELTTGISVYRLTGIDLGSSLVALDEHGDFFSQFSESSALIREGYEEAAPQLMDTAREIKSQQTEQLAARLTHKHEGPFAIRNVRILDPRDGSLSEPSTVVVAGDTITSITPFADGSDAIESSISYDGAGGTLMPGLLDMHSHTSTSSGLFYLAAGVTSTRDMGNENDFLSDFLERMDRGQAIGPRITPAGFVEGRSAFSARHGIIAASQDEAIEAVEWYAARGFGYVKSYNSMNPIWMPAVAEAAHERGMRLIGHIPAFTNADAMIEAGFDEVTHINQLMLGWLLEPTEDTRTPLRLTGMARGADLDLASEKVRRTVQLMQDNQVAIDPTAVILERLMLSRAGIVAEGDADYLAHMPIGYQRYRKRTFVTLKDAAEDEAYHEGFRRSLETIKLLHDAGISILPGTDDGTGFTVHRELELYTLAGIPNAEVLRIASWVPIQYMGYEDRLGSIEVGKLADMILLPGNPLEDIRALKTPAMVVKNGDVFLPSEIYTALGIRPFSDPPERISDN